MKGPSVSNIFRLQKNRLNQSMVYFQARGNYYQQICSTGVPLHDCFSESQRWVLLAYWPLFLQILITINLWWTILVGSNCKIILIYHGKSDPVNHLADLPNYCHVKRTLIWKYLIVVGSNEWPLSIVIFLKTSSCLLVNYMPNLWIFF